MRSLTAALVALALTTGCTSTTLINSRPDGAAVSIDGVNVGKTPATWSSTVWVGTKNSVQLSAPGYQPTTSFISADQWNVGKLVISIICFLPGILFSTEYRPSYEFTLQPATGTQGVSDASGTLPPLRLEEAPRASLETAPAAHGG